MSAGTRFIAVDRSGYIFTGKHGRDFGVIQSHSGTPQALKAVG